MKATGVIRRIDDLGRIVIPKEIRKNLRIKNGENLEIFTDEQKNIVLKKYSYIDNLKEISEELVNSIHKITKQNIFITNTQSVIATSKKGYRNKELSNDLINIIYKRKEINDENELEIINNYKENNCTLSPIIANGDLIGSVILSSEEKITKSDLNLIKVTSNFLARHIEG